MEVMAIMVVMAVMVTAMDTESAMLNPAMATADMEVTAIMVVMADMVMATAMENKNCQYLAVSLMHHVGQADSQNFVNIHSESLFCLFLCKFYSWEMRPSINMLLRVIHDLQNTLKPD